jgi:hypothetical protein
MMQDPNFDLSFEADAVKVARAGDVAYERPGLRPVRGAGDGGSRNGVTRGG